MTAVADVAGWWWLAVRVCAIDLWRWLPGPWPVKILLLAVLAAGQFVPGELDELVFLALIALSKRVLAWAAANLDWWPFTPGPAVSTWPIVLT